MAMQLNSRFLWTGGFILTLLFGIVYRLLWVDDIEYKADEQWTFQATQAFRNTGAIPALGMGSSAGIPNAGLSVWVFLVLSKLFLVSDPPTLARAVQITNIAAILGLVMFVIRCVERSEREPWFWSIALVSVNPLAVLFHRKIWPPSVFPIFTLTMMLGLWYRSSRWGAFVWGLVGICLGQIQLGGFFFAASVVLWVLLFDRRSVRWIYWLLGNLLGVILLIPWLLALLQSTGGTRQPNFGLLLQLPFYRHWFSIALGLDLKYSLGDNYLEFLSHPIISGHPFYGVAALHGVIFLVFISILGRFAYQIFKTANSTSYLFNLSSSSVFILSASFLGYGLLLSLPLLPIYLHYLIILFNLPYLGLAWMTEPDFSPHSRKISRLLLAVLCMSQILLTISFLGFIHEKQVIQGDYGTIYRAQQIKY